MQVAEKAYDEMVDLFARGTSRREIVHFHPSRTAQERATYLLDRNKTDQLTAEEAVGDQQSEVRDQTEQYRHLPPVPCPCPCPLPLPPDTMTKVRPSRIRELVRQFKENGMKMMLEHRGNVRDLLSLLHTPWFDEIAVWRATAVTLAGSCG
jgi:hypothetical protein